MRKRLLPVALVVAVALASGFGLSEQAAAQAANLLQNPGMENPYLGQGGAPDQTAPQNWALWFTGVPVTSYPHTDLSQVHGGLVAWNIRKGGAPFTAGGFQQVTGLKIGSKLHATLFAQSYTCNDQIYSCIGSDGKHHSDQASGAVVRVGVDPSGGTNPASGQIVWSSSVPSFDTWSQLAVDVVNCNPTVTFFTFTTQAVGMAINAVYFDDASLTVTQDGTGTTATCGAVPGTGSATSAPAAPTAPPLAPFVKRQNGEQPDGSIIHTVVAGDTLAAIAVAYGVTIDQLRQLNNIQPGDNLLKLGQKIIVRGPTPITPTNPATLVPTAGAVALAATTIPPSAVPTNGPISVGPSPTNLPPLDIGWMVGFAKNSGWAVLGVGLGWLIFTLPQG